MSATITIKDYPCGSGKTTGMIRDFKKDEKYLVILPELTEVDRVILATKHVTFVEPTTENNKLGTKTESLKELLLLGHNIATTHALYERLVPLAKEGLLDEYCIFIDEVPDVVKVQSSKSSVSIRDIYLDGGYIEVEGSGLVSPTDKWQQNRTEVSDTLDGKILRSAETGCLYLLGGRLFIWAMPSLLLSAGRSVTILTYKAEGSLLSPYLNRLAMPHIIERNKYREQEFREQAAQLLNIENIPAFVGRKDKPNLTFTGQTNGMKSKQYCSTIRNSLKNLAGRGLKEVNKNNILLTCLKDAWFDKSGKAGVFARGSKLFEKTNWCANTTRGTNKYAHCSHLIYLYDQHINPIVGRWLNDNSRAFDDAYALTELIQWVWRSRIREGEPITLYLPAPRMRRILINWLQGSNSYSFIGMSTAA